MNAMLAMLLTSQGHVWNIRVRRAAGKNAKFAERRQRALGITSARNVPRQQLSKKPLHHWCPFPTGGFRGLTEGCSHHELHQMGTFYPIDPFVRPYLHQTMTRQRRLCSDPKHALYCETAAVASTRKCRLASLVLYF